MRDGERDGEARDGAARRGGQDGGSGGAARQAADCSGGRAPSAYLPRMPDPFAIERAAAAAWPAAIAEERAGGLLRATPGVPLRRNNSALPLAAPDAGSPDRSPGAAGGGSAPDEASPGAPFGAPLDPAAVERFYAARGTGAVIAVAPAERHPALDGALEAAGWPAEGCTDVLVADSSAVALALPAPAGVERVDPLAWPDAAIRDEVIARSGGEVVAVAIGDRGAALCIRTGDLGGVFRLHVAPAARRRGIGARLLAACAAVAPVLYAQVERDNDAAQALFARAGFTRSHGYHYRRADPARRRPPRG